MEYLLSLLLRIQGAEYEVLDDSQEHWWKVKDENGYIIPFGTALEIASRLSSSETSSRRTELAAMCLIHIFFLSHTYIAVAPINRQS